MQKKLATYFLTSFLILLYEVDAIIIPILETVFRGALEYNGASLFEVTL